MRWVLAILFGAIGGGVCFVVIGDPSLGGAAGETVSLFSFAIGFIIGAPVGYLIGTLPLFASRPPPNVEPRKQFAPQIAGGICVVCGQPILFAGDGASCAKCENVFHSACVTESKCPSCQDNET